MLIRELPDDERKTIRAIIRGYCTVNKIYAKAHKQGIGLESTEEAMEDLIDSGKLQIIKENNQYFLRPRGTK